MGQPIVARALLAATALAVSAVVATGCGGSATVGPDAAVRKGLAAVEGIPQRGSEIGATDAPSTLIILDWVSDLRLAEVVQHDLYDVIARDVRPGKLAIQLRTIRFRADPDSEPAARILQSAGLQGRFWQALAAFLPNYTGVIADDTAQQAFRLAGVGSIPTAFRSRQLPQVTSAIDRADAMAAQMNVSNAPRYVLTKANGSTIDLSMDADRGRLGAAIDAALKR